MNDKRKTSIGSAVATVRKLVGMTQRRLAALAGYSTQWIAKIEGGEATPSLASVDAIAAALGVPVFVLFLETDTPSDEPIETWAGRQELRMICRKRYVLPAANKERESKDNLKRRRGISETLDESGFVANLFKEEG